MELDRLLELLAARQSPQARLKSDEPLQLWTDTGWVNANAPLVGGQLNRMLALAAPPEVRAVVHDLNARYEFDVSHHSGLYRVQVEAVNGRRTAFVTRLGADGQPLRPSDDGGQAFGLDAAPLPDSAPAPTSSAAPAQWKLEDEPLPDLPPPPKPQPRATPRTVVIDPVPVPVAGDSTANPPIPQSSNNAHWFYAHAGQTMGPHSFEQMTALVASGALPRETMVFHSQVGDWQQAKLSELGRMYPPENAGEWVNPSIANWQPPSEADVRAEKVFVRLVAGGGIGLVVLLVGWIALAQVRGSNRSFDYSPQFAQTVEKTSPTTAAGALHNVRLQRDDEEPKRYFGTGQYSNGYLADVELNVKTRDFWSRPQQTEFTAKPHDFTGELANLIESKVNSDLAKQKLKVRVERIALSHGQGNSYAGSLYFTDRTALPVSAEISGFSDEGTILNWSYDVDTG